MHLSHLSLSLRVHVDVNRANLPACFLCGTGKRTTTRWHTTQALHGDPNLLCIYGESAGAGSVSTHLVAPRSGGFFTRAIMESGPIAPWVGESLYKAEARFATLAAKVGCSNSSGSSASRGPSGQGGAGQGVDVVACLRSKNSTELQSHKPKCNGAYSRRVRARVCAHVCVCVWWRLTAARAGTTRTAPAPPPPRPRGLGPGD